MTRPCLAFCLAACLALALPPAVARAQAQSQEDLFPERAADCVIRPRDMIELTSLEEGVLTEILVDRGDMVEAGQVVARLESDLQTSALRLARLRAENTAAVSAAEARVAFRTEEVERRRALAQRSVASKADLAQAEVELTLAELELVSAKAELGLAQASFDEAELRLARRDIRAPVSGLVVRVSGALGEFAHEQAEVLSLAVLDPLRVEAWLPVDLYPRLALEQEAEVTIGHPLDTKREARVSAIDRVFDAGSGTFGVRLDLPNGDGSLPSGLKCGLRFHPVPASQ
ncbi:efflux RND transporter periplasmic adaptor subunit [Litorisediminicola beolgyonensis]|uniref:Efflux RND transporter periplasmic adaptor subunit n=1 Tax=Litorisediminicola beolgyonensis TaxID=1173614 RepID=A0ABW3ZDA6_9RHOB